ncbi:hypothetical protein [Pyrobaculum aerophilum]|uniref:hypothetical protein n=1 Tax=Pyrobaculum aerophilum TaxID=13773 RepID=UPI0015F27D70|nr:hypothetical protein [Pyrobaculum aerophilum]
MTLSAVMSSLAGCSLREAASTGVNTALLGTACYAGLGIEIWDGLRQRALGLAVAGK